MNKIIPQTFYQQPTLKVARQLLGKILVRKIGNQKLTGIITETEAYVGPNDLASHASRGKTPRNQIMFGPPGFWYVYLIYGMHYCLNVVTEKKQYPAAVLIRSVLPQTGIQTMIKNRQTTIEKNLTNGPGKLCQAFKINKNFNGAKSFSYQSFLYIMNNSFSTKSKIIAAPRVGIDYAGKYKNKLWRFILKNKTEQI